MPIHSASDLVVPPKNGTNNNCVAGYGAAGAAAGASLGWLGGGAAAVFGAETGPTDIAIAYGGKILSSAVGTYVGQQAGQLIGNIVCSSSAGGGGGAGGGGRVTFGHGGRHLAGSGLNQNQVEAAIKAQVQEIANTSSSTGSFWGKVVVNGQQIFYRAFTLPDGTINVGTYTVGAP